ncbi:MAG: hypothetical protein KBF57_09880 [Saprospiraceae bacterium]|nr:hypothetical protein [Saprospiraceae bacterium]HRG66366.1 hypothetical protein [Saprospiraceae bacterium]
MKTTLQLVFTAATLVFISFLPSQTIAQHRGGGIPDLSEEQRLEMRKLKDDHFLERNRMNDRMRNDRMEMRKKYDQRLRSILTEKQYYAFKQKAKNKGMKRHGQGRNGQDRKGQGHRGSRQGRGQRSF